MKHFPTPTRSEQEEFLIRLFAERAPTALRQCVERAYLDFSRTLHGIWTSPRIRQPATAEVEKRLIELRDDATISNQEAFDEWHRTTCDLLRAFYSQRGYGLFHIGQAQKWLNMSLKYIYAVGDQRLPGYDRLYEFGHIPLDNIILARLQTMGNPPVLSARWSRLQDYDEYLRFQIWIRRAFSGSAPLAVEFHLWQV